MSRLQLRLALACAVSLVAVGGAATSAIAAPTIGDLAAAADPQIDSCEVPGDCPPPEAPVDVRVTSIGSTTALVEWTRATDPSVASYVIEGEGLNGPLTTAANARALQGLQPGTTYTGTVRSVSTSPNAPDSAPVAFTFKTTQPVPSLPVTVDYGVTGSAEIGTLVRGSLPIKGSTTLTFSRPTYGGDYRNVEGTLTLGQTTGRLITLGYLPVTAKLAFVSSGRATGMHGGFTGGLVLSQTVRIKVLEAKLFGAIPLASGNDCQSKQLTTLVMAGPPFARAKGGSVSGGFSISNLNGCGSLNGLVSPVTAGAANTISLKLAAS